MYKKRTSKGAFHHNCVTGKPKQPLCNCVAGDANARRAEGSSAELTPVNEHWSRGSTQQ
ncbi:hypothetical protein [Shewanella sp.]|uniref:hypothetical protein n=1 Tax=Shewanella sp. TaxID=50422 RepID=UPI00258A2FBF|nr:hypothetical protein [Shewanella sp.]MCJ8304154.1 hypothetical protein [Shewanella sp.]